MSTKKRESNEGLAIAEALYDDSNVVRALYAPRTIRIVENVKEGGGGSESYLFAKVRRA